MRALVAAIAALLLAGAAATQVVPRAEGGDPHIQTAAYAPDQVVALRVAAGYAVSIAFAPDERIMNVAVGAGAAWQITANRDADHLFVKPTKAGSETNLLVLTSQRQYVFALTSLSYNAPDAPYTLRFTYPVASPAPEAPGTSAAAPMAEEGRYRLSGSRSVRPVAISDDGRRTTIEWAPTLPVPAIFANGADGTTRLVEARQVDGRTVIDGIAARYLFVLERARATATRQRPRAQ